ncbi:MAG: hypothetical protein J6P44_02275 [Bacteroidales bacterium]|nr:hypothetical protein [Bacteroidales bacterium]
MLDKNNKEHYKRLQRYAKEIQAIFEKYNQAFATIGLQVEYSPENGLFQFSNYPELNDALNRLLNQFFQENNYVISNGVTNEWNIANDNNDLIAKTILADAWSKTKNQKYFKDNDKVLEAFLKRKENGLDLSQKVWKYTGRYKQNIEDALSVGISEGKSAAEISRDIRRYLNEPNRLYRHILNMAEKYNWSKIAQSYHPGVGRYRSSYKNALRLAVTETNIAYRTADYERWKNMDFILGIEIQLSGNHPVRDICDDLKGKYPKDFKFTGWHPHCRCFATPIIMSDEEYLNDDYSKEVIELPQNFQDWYSDNQERIQNANKLPYFIKDNQNILPYIMSEKDAQKLIKDGFIKINATEYNNATMKGFDLVTFNKSFNSAFKDYDISWEDKRCYMGNGYSVLYYEGKYKNESICLERYFRREESGIVVDHMIFQLPDEIQGKGISKKVFKELFQQYDKMGVSKVYVSANIDVGGYCWAKYGFNISKNEYFNLLDNLKWNVSDVVQNHLKEAKLLYNKYAKNDVFNMGYLAENEWAKEFLKKTHWHGWIDLRDKEQMKYLWDYLRKRKRK